MLDPNWIIVFLMISKDLFGDKLRPLYLIAFVYFGITQGIHIYYTKQPAVDNGKQCPS